MRPVSRFLFMLTLALFLAGLPRVGYAQTEIGDPPEGVPVCFLPAMQPRKLQIVVPDLVPLAGSPDMNATAVPEYLNDNFSLTGLFEILDKRASLEKDLEAGVVGGTEPDYEAWKKIGADYLIKGGIKSEGSKLTLELRLFDVALGKQLLGKRFIGRHRDARKMTNEFTNAALKTITGTPGVFGSEIIFASGPPSQKQIYKTTMGSDEAIGITNNIKKFNMRPTIGLSGSVAWVSRDREKKNPWELVRDGQVVSSGDLHLSPAFKPDGSLVAALSGPRQSAIYDFSVKPPKLLIDLGGINVSPTFSPDGSRMAFTSDANGSSSIYVASASGDSTGARLTSGAKATDPAWSPTGEYIAFVIRETDICIIRPDGTGFRQLTGGQGANSRPSFSPDGRLIVFSSTRNGRQQLFTINTNGDNQRPLLPNLKIPQEQLYWSPVWPDSFSDNK